MTNNDLKWNRIGYYEWQGKASDSLTIVWIVHSNGIELAKRRGHGLINSLVRYLSIDDALQAVDEMVVEFMSQEEIEQRKEQLILESEAVLGSGILVTKV